MDLEPTIQIQHLSKRFGDFAAVDCVSLDIRRGEFFSLLGPSGCGKTTLLRMIAGFEQPSGGQLLIGGREMRLVPPYRRPVNLVFQHFALFPHLTVAKNVAFGLRYQDAPKAEHARRVDESLALVRLAGLERRYPHELSGGQKQRVALARALVLRPQVLLLDEPLGALDQKLRKEMQVELKNLQRSLGITFVFVTHDQEEAMTMSDRIAVMNAGKVEQCDAAVNVFEYPRTEFVAHFMGAANFFTEAQRRFIVRPEKLSLRSVPPAGEKSLPVTIEQQVYQGVSTVYTVRALSGEIFTVYEQNTRPFDAHATRETKVLLCWDPLHEVTLDASARSAKESRALLADSSSGDSSLIISRNVS